MSDRGKVKKQVLPLFLDDYVAEADVLQYISNHSISEHSAGLQKAVSVIYNDWLPEGRPIL